MKTAAFALAVMFLCVVSATAQKPPAKSKLIPDVPREDRFGNVIVHNSSVSARKLEIPAGASISIPASTRDYLVIALEKITMTASGGSNSFELALNEGDMQVMLGGWPHKLINKGNQQARLVTVEILRNIDPQHATCGLSAPNCHEVRFGKSDRGEYTQTALFETGTTRLLRAQLGPGSSLEMHADGRKHLIIPLTQLHGRTEQESFTLAAGDVHWIDGGFSTLLNDDVAEARMLIVELKK